MLYQHLFTSFFSIQFSNPWPSGWRPPPVAPRCSPLSSTSTRPHRCRCRLWIEQIPSQDIQDIQDPRDIHIPKITKAIPSWVELVNSHFGGPWGVLLPYGSLRQETSPTMAPWGSFCLVSHVLYPGNGKFKLDGTRESGLVSSNEYGIWENH